MSIIFNGDENRLMVRRGVYTQDLRETHPVCSLVFMSLDELEVEGNSFVYMETEWECISYRRMAGSLIYSVLGYPAGASKLVEGSHSSLRGLASAVGCAVDVDSEDLPFEFPLKGVRLGPLLYKYRYQSFERSMGNFGGAYFLHLDGRGLVGSTYSSLVSGEGFDFDVKSPVLLGSSYLIQDDLRNRYREDPVPRKVSYQRLSTAVFGDKVEMRGMLSGVVGRYYVLHTGAGDLVDIPNLVLIHQRYDSSNGVQPWTLTFGSLLV